jgi:hypothetical protein
MWETEGVMEGVCGRPMFEAGLCSEVCGEFRNMGCACGTYCPGVNVFGCWYPG